MKISAIIFDLGGVVFNNDWHDENQKKFAEYSNVFNITYDDMERGWDKAWPGYALGKISEDKFWTIFLTEARSSNIDIKKAKELWKKYVVENEEMISLLKKLKKKYKLGALTTIAREWLDYKSDKYNLSQLFDTIVSSGYSGLYKPDLKIYRKILKDLNITPNECVFVDDSLGTLPPAKKLGIYPILFTSQKELEKKLRELDISF